MVKIKEYSQDIRDVVAKHCEQGKGAKQIILIILIKLY
jgi:hypothetical protein